MANPLQKTHKPSVEKFQAGPWTIVATKSHILKSEGPERDKFMSALRLPEVPEMVFADNSLRLQHASGVGLEFNALDALKLVDAEHDLMKVAVAQAWKEARSDCEHINDVIKPFDWTYTTNYKGTLTKDENKEIIVTETTEKINIEKLKVREKIFFYADILLFEDELADHGCAILRAKIRVMPSGFFILLRFYLRVDNLLIRVNDTRLHHEAEKNYILREYTSKEKQIPELKVPTHIMLDPDEISQHLSTKEEVIEKLELPQLSDSCNNSGTET